MASKQGYKRDSAKKEETWSYLDMIRCNGNQHPLFHIILPTSGMDTERFETGDFSASDFSTKTDKKNRGSSQLRVRGSTLDTTTQYNDISEECEIDIGESEQAQETSKVGQT